MHLQPSSMAPLQLLSMPSLQTSLAITLVSPPSHATGRPLVHTGWSTKQAPRPHATTMDPPSATSAHEFWSYDVSMPRIAVQLEAAATPSNAKRQAHRAT